MYSFISFLKKAKTIIFFYFKRTSLYRYFTLPIKKEQFFFDSFNGRSFSDSPKYLYLYLTKNGIAKPESCVWTCRDKDSFRKQIGDERVKLVEYGSKEYIKACMTSRILIINVFLLSIIPIRKNQCLINTWHGTPYKKIAMSNTSSHFFSKKLTLKAKAKQTKYFLTNTSYFSELLPEALYINHEKQIKAGFPRNDFLINKQYDEQEIKNKLCAIVPTLSKEKLENKIIVLYAPTNRSKNLKIVGMQDLFLPLHEIQDSIEKRFNGKVIFIFRTHYEDVYTSIDDDSFINGSSYPDMQELMAISDILITDYSSTIWDFGFTKRPCFLYTPDLKEYQGTRDFYIPIEEWPFPKATTIAEMNENILSYDENDYLKKLKKHYEELGSYETGTACEQVASLIQKEIET